jgi:DNA-binding protein YbaB
MAEAEERTALAELDQIMQREAELADAMQRRLESVRSSATSPGGEVTVVVDCAGSLCDVDLKPEALELGAAKLADTIRETSLAARAALPDLLREAADDK